MYYMVRGLSFTSIGYFLNLFQKNVKITNFSSNKYFITFIEIYTFTFLIKNIKNYPKIIISMWCFFLIYLFIEKKGALSRILNNNCFTYISKYCYSVYISHENITRDSFRKIGIYKKLRIQDDRLIIILLSFIIGMLLYYLNKIVYTKFLRKIFNNNNKIIYNQEENNNKLRKIQII